MIHVHELLNSANLINRGILLVLSEVMYDISVFHFTVTVTKQNCCLISNMYFYVMSLQCYAMDCLVKTGGVNLPSTVSILKPVC